MDACNKNCRKAEKMSKRRKCSYKKCAQRVMLTERIFVGYLLKNHILKCVDNYLRLYPKQMCFSFAKKYYPKISIPINY